MPVPLVIWALLLSSPAASPLTGSVSLHATPSIETNPAAPEDQPRPLTDTTDTTDTASPPLTEPSRSPPAITPPARIDALTAIRPASAPSATIEALLRLDIDAEGFVTRVEVVESGGTAFDRAAVDAARRFRFEPATQDGTPFAARIQYRYVFEPAEASLPTDPEPPAPLTIDETAAVTTTRPDSEAAQIELTAEKGERLPGAQGDALKATQTLAGVARPSAGRGELAIWGSLPAESRLYIDGMPVPRLFHLGGSRSVLPTPLVDSVTLVPGGFGAAYGRALGGFVEARTREPRPRADPRRVGGFARLDPLDASAGVDARLTDRGWVTAAVRRSLLAQTYGAVAPPSSAAVVPLPDYWDYQAKSVVQLSERDSISFVGVGSHDRVERGIPSLTPDAAFSEQRTSGFHRLGVTLRHVRDDGSRLYLMLWGGRDDERWIQRFSDAQALDERGAWRGGLRIDERRRLASFVRLRWGLDLELDRTAAAREGAITLPAREGDIVVFGQPPGDRISADRWTTVRAGLAAYASLRFEWGEGRWAIEPGLRVEPLLRSGDRTIPVRPVEPALGYLDLDLALDPRLRVRWSPLPALTLFSAGGRYHRAPDPADLSAQFGNPRLGPARAYHAVAGARLTPLRPLELELTGLWRRATSLTGRSEQPTPAVATLLVAEGDGRSYGAQLTANIRPLDSLYGQVSYAWVRAERRDPGAARWRRFDLDQPHRLQALAGWIHRRGVELSGRVELGSGNPRTPVVGAVFDARTGRYDPVFGEHNAERLPLAFALSARVGWSRAWPWGELRTWLDVYNVTNRRNTDEVFYTSDFSQRGAVTGLPILPSLGVQIRR